MILSESQAKEILAPYLDNIYKCIDKAISEYMENPNRLIYSRRTRANIISDIIRINAYKYLNGPSVKYGFKNNGFYIVLEDKIRLKFKMLDNNLRTKNIPTQQVLNFLNQHQMKIEFSDPPQAITNVFAGYKWNSIQTAHDGIYVVCPNGSKNEWKIPVAIEDVSIKQPEIINHTAQIGRKRVKVRKGDDNVTNIENK